MEQKYKKVLIISLCVGIAILLVIFGLIMYIKSNPKTIVENNVEDFKDNQEENAENQENNEEENSEVLKVIIENEEKNATTQNQKIDNNQNNSTNASSNYYIKINNALNTVTIYKKDKNGQYTEPFKAMICSIGKETPSSGVYTVPGTGTWHGTWGSMVGNVYAQYWVRIYKGILFHSVPYTSGWKNSAKGTLEWWEYDKLGTKASAGCIRLKCEDAKWIYDNIKPGTQVEFYWDYNSPGPLGKPTAKKLADYPENLKGWDPTDPDPSNPWHTYKEPIVENVIIENTENDDNNQIQASENTNNEELTQNVSSDENENQNELNEENNNQETVLNENDVSQLESTVQSTMEESNISI